MESKSLSKRENKNLGILLIATSTILIAFAQLLLKIGASKINTFFSFFNLYIIIGIILYGIATILFIFSLNKGNLSTLYPILGLSYIWVSLLSYFVLNEVISSFDLLGITLIVIGVAVLGGSKDD